METLWIIELCMGFGLAFKAWHATDGGVRMISRTFGPLLGLTGLVGFAKYPLDWQLAVTQFACIMVGAFAAWFCLIVLDPKK